MTTTKDDDITCDRGVKISIKSSGKQDATWFVFEGTVDELTEDIAKAFSITWADGTAPLDLGEIAAQASRIAQGMAQVVNGLGARPVPTPAPTSSTSHDSGWQPVQGAPASDDNGWGDTGAAPGTPADPNMVHLTAMAKIDNVDELKRYWGKNQASFAGNESLTAAFKARGKALTAAAAS